MVCSKPNLERFRNSLTAVPALAGEYSGGLYDQPFGNGVIKPDHLAKPKNKAPFFRREPRLLFLMGR